jgi:hypothetical protein
MPRKSNPFPASKAVKVNKRQMTFGTNCLTSWVNFSKFLPLKPVELKRFIIVERETRNRDHMLKRLIGLLHTAERHELYKKLGL